MRILHVSHTLGCAGRKIWAVAMRLWFFFIPHKDKEKNSWCLTFFCISQDWYTNPMSLDIHRSVSCSTNGVPGIVGGWKPRGVGCVQVLKFRETVQSVSSHEGGLQGHTILQTRPYRDESRDSTEWKRIRQDSRSKWTPDVDTSRPPVVMMIKPSELRVTGFKVKEWGPGLRSLEGMDP